jgi:pseudouridine-5'-phosphate glycosidase/pseudouridine kinase
LIAAREKGTPIDVHPEVEQALVENLPLVALETTIVTHGMPYPVNLETAKSVERHVRSAGAIPATIGVIGGRVKVGLEPAQLEYLADLHTNPGTVKLSRRDIGPALALKKDGGTTCSATLIFAALAGIKVSAGFTSRLMNGIEPCLGIFYRRVRHFILLANWLFSEGWSRLGGVHRGGQDCELISVTKLCAVHEPSEAMDISADLQDLARCPVGLVSAGAKSILDIGRYTLTLQRYFKSVTELIHLQDIRIPRMYYAPLDYHPFTIQLEQETLGVPVVTYGETQDFPAFYSPTSGFKVRFRLTC